MKKVTLKELKDMAINSRSDVWQKAQSLDREPKIYLHWTAGKYDSLFSDYHINITGNGDIYVSTDDLSEVKNHTWKRNTGAIGIGLCCAYGGGSTNLGDYPPTVKQIETVAQVIDVVCAGLWLTIDKAHVMTHGEASNNEDGLTVHNPYAWWNDSYGDGDTRGDLEYLGTKESPKYNPYATDGSRGGDVLRGKANWYKNNKKDV